MTKKKSTELLQEITKPSENLNYHPPFPGCDRYVEEKEILNKFFKKVNSNP